MLVSSCRSHRLYPGQQGSCHGPTTIGGAIDLKETTGFSQKLGITANTGFTETATKKNSGTAINYSAVFFYVDTDFMYRSR
jgi:hypothetical protein